MSATCVSAERMFSAAPPPAAASASSDARSAAAAPARFSPRGEPPRGAPPVPRGDAGAGEPGSTLSWSSSSPLRIAGRVANSATFSRSSARFASPKRSITRTSVSSSGETSSPTLAEMMYSVTAKRQPALSAARAPAQQRAARARPRPRARGRAAAPRRRARRARTARGARPRG